MAIKITTPRQSISNGYKQAVHVKRRPAPTMKKNYLLVGRRRRQLTLQNWLRYLDEAIVENQKATTVRSARRTSITTGYDENSNVVLRLAVPKRPSFKKPRRNAILIRSLSQASKIIDFNTNISTNQDNAERSSFLNNKLDISLSLQQRLTATSLDDK